MDHAATTPIGPEVAKAMEPWLGKEFGNPSSLFYTEGLDATDAVEKSRRKVEELLGAEKDEIIFTSGGTEANNLAVIGFAMKNKGNHIITTKIEHPAVIEACKYLEENGFDVTYLGVGKDGILDLEELKKAIKKKTILISVEHANVETGVIQPISEIGKIARENKIAFHCDACQSCGYVPVNVKDMNVDLLSITAHKFYGPKGVGALYVKKGTQLEPLFHGGGQEFGLRSGMENVAGIVGLAKALEVSVGKIGSERDRLEKLRDKLIEGVLKIENSWLSGHPTQRLPGSVNIGFRYIEGEAIVMSLDMVGVASSTGSACSSKTLSASPVLMALGQTEEETHGSLRLSLGRENTEGDVEYVLKELPKIVEELRRMSPLREGVEFEPTEGHEH